MIKNIIFDIGNVIVTWQPAAVVARCFPEQDTELLTKAMFKSELWFELNLGQITMNDLINSYHQTLRIETEKLRNLMHLVQESLLPINGSIELLTNLHQAGYSLYALTDNVHEFMIYMRKKYDFWSLFTGVVVSAEVGYLKPSPEIYETLINKYQLNREECIFIDDHLPNVVGAKAVGINSFQFTKIEQFIEDLNKILNC